MDYEGYVGLIWPYGIPDRKRMSPPHISNRCVWRITSTFCFHLSGALKTDFVIYESGKYYYWTSYSQDALGNHNNRLGGDRPHARAASVSPCSERRKGFSPYALP